VGSHSHTSGGLTHGSGSDPEDGGIGWAWSQFGSPRADDGTDGGDERPSLNHHSSPSHSARHSLPGQSGLLGSVDDQDYVGGGYGWKTFGAPRANTAVPGSASSVGSTLTQGVGGNDLPAGDGLAVDSAPLPSPPGDTGSGGDPRGRRSRWWLLLAALPLALLIGVGVVALGGPQHRDTPVTPGVVSSPAPTPTTAAVSPTQPSLSGSVPAPPPVSETTTPTAPVNTAQSPPQITSQIAAPRTTSAALPPALTATSGPATLTATPPTSVPTITPPTTSIPRKHGGNTGANSGSDSRRVAK
jgi:hypothetical protein